MERIEALSRRRLLEGVGGLSTLGVLAGCTGDGGDGTDGSGDGAGESGADGSSTATDTPENTDTDEENTDGEETDTDDGSDSDELDLREANVVGVAFESADGSYTFDVSLHHDDDGEAGYANWWQVERPDGTRLGRRDLLHAHSQQPFTRSETIDVPEGVTCVVVRGHDQTHGYGGRAMLVDLESGATRAVDQGPDSQSFDGSDCP